MSLRKSFHSGRLEAGCDEAGRGCLAGPVFAAAVILPENLEMPLLNDSKKLTRKQRYQLRKEIQEQALAYSVAWLSNAEIDHYNIFKSSIYAMHKALDDLRMLPEFLLIDGKFFYPYREISHECVIKGDGKYLSIAAASVLAKTYRDDFMIRIHEEYPDYQWDQNKGYPTKAHREAIQRFGPTPYHRKSFRLLPEAQQLEIKELK